MNDLVKQVIQRLKEREQTSITVSFNQSALPPNEQIFLTNGQVVLKNVSINLITSLYSLDKNDLWIKWILTGLSYDVKFYFQVNEQVINFIPRMMILDWPIIFVVNNESPLIASYNRIITRSELAVKPDKSILVRWQKQTLTDEAIDICNYKKIRIKVRTEENCIWRE